MPLTSDEVEDDFMDFISDEQDKSDSDQDCEDYEFGTSSDAKVDDYVLLCLRGKKTLHYYVGQVLQINDNDDEVSSKILKQDRSRESSGCFMFYMHEDAELCTHGRGDIEIILLRPLQNGGTKRSQKGLVFPVDLSACKPE